MAQRMDNPAQVITRWLPTSDKGIDLLAVAPPLFLHNRIGYEHYLGELQRSQYRRLAGDPSWLSHYILSSYIAEVGAMLEQAKTIPVIGTIVPSREVVLLPAWMLAMAGLAIEIHEQAEALGKKKEEIRQKQAQSLTEHKPAAEWELFSQGLQVGIALAIGLPPMSRLGPGGPLWSPRVAFPVKARHHGLVRCVDAKREHTSLWADELKLGLDLYHFGRTFVMDPHALNDAVIRMPEHLETINRKGQEVLPKVLLYCQQKVGANKWVSDKFDLRTLNGKDVDWVKKALPTLKGYLETLASYMPKGQDIEELAAKYNVEKKEQASPPPQVPPPTSAPKGGFKTLAWLGTVIFSFWVGRRFFGKQAPILPSVPT